MGSTENEDGIFKAELVPLSFPSSSYLSEFLISKPAMTLLPLSPVTDLTIYHLLPRFMYSGTSEIPIRGDDIPLPAGIILSKGIFTDMLSFRIGNWLFHDIRESSTNRYITMSSGILSGNIRSSAGVCRAFAICLSRILSLFSTRSAVFFAMVSVSCDLPTPVMDTTNITKARTSPVNAIVLCVNQFLIIGLFMVVRFAPHDGECSVYLLREYGPYHLM